MLWFSNRLRLGWQGRRPGSVSPALLRYGLALGLVVLAFFARLGLDPWLGQESHPYATFYIAVAVGAAWLGLGPGLVLMGVGLIASLWFIVPPRQSVAVRGLPDLIEILLYVFVSGTVVFLIQRLQRARAEAAENARLAQQKQQELEADMVARRRAEQALRDSEEHLERVVEERTARLRETIGELEHFSYALVHDMRAPLRAMRGYISLLKDQFPDSALEAQEFCGRIEGAAGRLDLLICDSLNYTKVARRALPVRAVDLDNLVTGLVDTYPNLQRHRQDIHIKGKLPRVLGNEAGLTETFSNLLDNAIKFVVPGSRPQVLVWAECHNGLSRINVQDNGIGIPAHALHRMFGMFQRLTHEYEGTGIGLAIARKAVERMGGRIGAESQPGKGSRFWVELTSANETPAIVSSESATN
jgi:signal transduction histidine kinase